MSQRHPSKTLLRGRSQQNRKTVRNCLDPNLSFLQQSSVKATSPRISYQRHLASTVRNSNPERSVSMKDKHRYRTKATSHRHTKRLRKPLHNVSQFELPDGSIYAQSITLEQKQLDESLMRTSMLRELAGQGQRTKLIRDLQLNSLELFRMGEKNVEKRMKLLYQHKDRLGVSWNKLLDVLKTADNRDRIVVDEAVKNLIGQRLYLEKEIENTKDLLEGLRL